MNKIYFLISISLMLACANPSDGTKKIPYTEVESLAVEGNQENTYAISKPLDAKGLLPLIIGLDAQGEGQMAAEKLRSACQDFPAVVVASNVIRNGYPNFKEAIKELIQECVTKYSVDEKNIILVGFSGGARMAQFFSKDYPVSGVVMIGAGPGAELPDVTTFALCGIEDFNFIEMYRRPIIEMITEESICFDYFYGKHEWPGADEIRDGILFHLRTVDEKIVNLCNQRAEELIRPVDTLVMAGQGIFAWNRLDKAYKLTSDQELRKRIKANAEDLLENEPFRLSISKLENYLRLGLNLRRQFLSATRSEDFEYWKNEITHYRELSMYSSNTWEIYHARRILGYLGIMFYSQLKMAIMAEGVEERKQILINAFAYLEPKNPDMFYFKAIWHTQNENMDSASHYLALARKNGLKE